MNKSVAKTPLVKLIPLLVRGVAPAAAITFGLSPATSVSAPGDLDPGFGDFGRVGPITDFDGAAWSAEALGTDGTLIAGGDYCGYYCYYFSYGTPGLSSFAGELSGNGSPVSSFVPAQLPKTEIFDSALLPDGSLILVGRSLVKNLYQLTVAKLSSAGPLDTSFGTGGVFTLNSSQQDSNGTSVTVDPDGHIVVAGPQDNPAALIVVRLLANGTLDASFGTSGIYTGPASEFASDGINILGTGGGYRVTTADCTIIGLTTAGKLDATFGTAGTVTPLPGQALACYSLEAQPDGRLLAAGVNGAHSYATRLLANGAPDASFSGSAIVAGMSYASAVAVAGDGSGAIVVAGGDPAGTPDAVIMRLQSSGQLDTSFGRAGTTLIDLPSEFGSTPVVHDLVWHPDGSVVAAGGDGSSRHPFVVRLLGTGGAGVPGVIGPPQPQLTTNEQSNEVVVKVRRTGGAAGTVSVAYQTQAVAANSSSATSGKDFGAVSGRLTWNDGDTAEQEIHVPILADNITEESEYFRLQLTDPQGGAGLGTRNATVEIQPDGSPYGQFAVNQTDAIEGSPAQVSVSRNYYVSGAVSVTLTPVAGTASAGSDFDPTPVTVSWADGEGGSKSVNINIPADGMQEPQESFTVQLSNPTGGALLGPHSTAEVTIEASTAPPQSSGGGGSFGMLGMLILGAAKFLQSAWLSVRRRRPSS